MKLRLSNQRERVFRSLFATALTMLRAVFCVDGSRRRSQLVLRPSQLGLRNDSSGNRPHIPQAPGADCEISVTFDPSSAGAKQGQLSVASQGGLAPPASTELSGTGAGPVVSIAPSRRTFEPLDLGGGPSASKTFTIAHEGQLDLSISSIATQANQIYNYPGAAAEQFELAGGTCKVGVAVPPGASCTVDVTFSPTPKLRRSLSSESQSGVL